MILSLYSRCKDKRIVLSKPLGLPGQLIPSPILSRAPASTAPATTRDPALVDPETWQTARGGVKKPLIAQASNITDATEPGITLT